MSATTKLQLPPSNVPLEAADGSLNNAWRSFFLAMIERLGGVTGGFQAADDTLEALAGLDASGGLLVQTAADVFTKRSLVGTAGNVVVANGSGAGGNPTVNLAAMAGVAGVHANPTSITVDGFGRITAIS